MQLLSSKGQINLKTYQQLNAGHQPQQLQTRAATPNISATSKHSGRAFQPVKTKADIFISALLYGALERI